MASKPASQTYYWYQIALHWLVAILVAAQYGTGGSIERTHHAAAHGLEVNSFDLLLHKIHNRTGLIILGLMLIRLMLRLLVGVPAPLAGEASWHKRLARAAHIGFYVILITQASTGAVASYFFWPIAAVHVVLSKVLLALIGLHASAALWHVFVVRDGVMARMVPWRSAGASVTSPSSGQGAL